MDIINKIYDKLWKYYEDYRKVQETSLDPIKDIQSDFKNKKIIDIFFDIVGLIGLILVLYTYYVSLIHIIRYRTIRHLRKFNFILRLGGYMMIILFAYWKHYITLMLIIQFIVIFTIMYLILFYYF